MKTLLLLVSLLLALPAFSVECPEGLFEAPNGKCRRERRIEAPKAKKVDVPGLGTLRAKRPIPKLSPPTSPAAIPSPMPVPGGLGGGTLFKQGQLPTDRIGQLAVTVLVPETLAPTNENLVWLFLTSTNRTEKGVEFVVGYSRAGKAFMGVFDWSCSETHPCPAERGGVIVPLTAPDWIWTHDVVETPEYLFPVIDDGKHKHSGLRYVNRTERIGPEVPPRWRNTVRVWNQGAGLYDLVYEHEYVVEQQSCVVTGCAWWGPILESFPDEANPIVPEIREVGFEDARLRYDGGLAMLDNVVTDFSAVTAPWTLSHSEPNHSYGAGNVFPNKANCGIGPELILLLPLFWRRLRSGSAV